MGYDANRRAILAEFDPATEPGFSLLADWDFARASVSAGRIVSIASHGTTQTLTVPSGSSGPLYVASAPEAGNKPAGDFEGDGTVDCSLYCSTFAVGSGVPFTAYFGCQQRVATSNRYQHLWTGGTTRVYTYPGTPAEQYILDGSPQLQTGIVAERAGGAALVVTWNGLLSSFSDSSQTPDVIGSIGTSHAIGGGVRIAGYNGSAAYSFGGRIFRILAFLGAHTRAQNKRVLNFLNSLYYMPIDFDVPGTRKRTKLNFNTNSNTIPTIATGWTDAITASGSANVYFRMTPTNDAGQAAGGNYWSVTRNDVSGPCTGRTSDGAADLKVASTDYKSVVSYAWELSADVETFARFKAGGAPKFAFRNGGPWINLPFDAATLPSLAAITGDADLAGWRYPTGTLFVDVGIVKEFTSFEDGAGPRGWADELWSAGALVFWGNSISSMDLSGGWPAFALGAVQTATAKLFPRPRQVGQHGYTWAQMTANRATYVDPLYVSATGATNIICISEGVNSMSTGGGAPETPAQAFSDALACAAALRARGWKIVMGLTYYNTNESNANVDAYNAMIVADGNTHWDATAMVPTTITRFDGIHPSAAGAKLIGAAFGTAIASLLP